MANILTFNSEDKKYKRFLKYLIENLEDGTYEVRFDFRKKTDEGVEVKASACLVLPLMPPKKILKANVFTLDKSP